MWANRRRPTYTVFVLASVYLLVANIAMYPSDLKPNQFQLKPNPVEGEDAVCGSWVPCQMLQGSCQTGNQSSIDRQCGIGRLCEYDLEALSTSRVTKFNISVEVGGGSSFSFLYKLLPKRNLSDAGQDPEYNPTGILVRVLCLPYFPRRFVKSRFIPKFLHSVFDSYIKGATIGNWLHLPCPKLVTGNLNKVEVAAWRIAKMCGADYLVPEARMGEVKGRMPETGYEFVREGLFQKEADGLSLKTIMNEIKSSSVLQEILSNKINSSQVVDGAIFDLLTRQRDRNSGNIIISESGDIQLIDNNSAFTSRVSSLLLPGTRLHTMKSVGPKYMETSQPEDAYQFPVLSTRLDYRCHTNGTIDKNFPPHWINCMDQIQSSSPRILMHELGLDSSSMVMVLKQSATDMLQKGFEWTLHNGGPDRKGAGFYPQDACCGFDPQFRSRRKAFACQNKWTPHLNLHEEYKYNVVVVK